MLRETLHNAAYQQKRLALASYINVLLLAGFFDQNIKTPLIYDDNNLALRMENSIKSGEILGARVYHKHINQTNNLVFGDAPEMFMPASMAKPVILAGAIKRGESADWIDDKLAYKLIVDSDNQTFEDVMKRMIHNQNPSSLPAESDQLLLESGVKLYRDKDNKRLVDIKTLAEAFHTMIQHLPLPIQNALVIPKNPHDTTDMTSKALAKLQARLKSTSPFLFKIGLDKNEKGHVVTSYFMQIGQELSVGYCVGGRFAATKQILDVASHLMQINKLQSN